MREASGLRAVDRRVSMREKAFANPAAMVVAALKHFDRLAETPSDAPSFVQCSNDFVI
jgi:hypothetical protein